VYYPEVHSAIEVPFVTPDLSPADQAVVDHPFFNGVVDAAAQGDEAQALSLAAMLAPILVRSGQEILALAKTRAGVTGNSEEAAAPGTLDEIAEH